MRRCLALLLALVTASPVDAAITVTQVADNATAGTGDSSNVASYAADGSVTWTSGSCFLLLAANTKGTLPESVSSVSGTGVPTFTLVNEVALGSSNGRMSILRAPGNGSSGTPTVNYNAVNQTGAMIKVLEVTGMDNGSSCASMVVQSVTGVDAGGAESTATCTFAAFSNGGNVGVLASLSTASTQTWSPEAGWAEFDDQIIISNPTAMMGASSRTGQDSSATNTTGNGGRWACVALEIAIAAGSSPTNNQLSTVGVFGR